MAAKLGFELVKQAMLKLLMKKGDDGIVLTLPKNEIVDLNARITMDRLIKAGIDPESLTSPDQVLNVLENINNQIINNARVIPGTSAEGKAITEKLFGKKGEVVDMTGKKIDTSQGIMGGKSVKELMESGQVQKGTDDIKISDKITEREMFKNSNLNKKDSITETISYIKTLEPIDAMKEANSVIGRKGKYKNLTPEESKKILQDTEDHIFERDIPDEDFATGGRAGYAVGNQVMPEVDARMQNTYEQNIKLNQIQRNMQDRVRKGSKTQGLEIGQLSNMYGRKPTEYKLYNPNLAMNEAQKYGAASNMGLEPEQIKALAYFNTLQKNYGDMGMMGAPLSPPAGGRGPMGGGIASFTGVAPGTSPFAMEKFFKTPAERFAQYQEGLRRTMMLNPNSGIYFNPKGAYDTGEGVFGAGKSKFKSGIYDFAEPDPNASRGMMIDGKEYFSEQDAIDDMGVERYNQFMASGGRAGYYTGGITDVEPSLDDIGHGSDSLMSRTRLMSPGAQATTSTGLNYLLAEDNDNLRVPFSKGKIAKEVLDKGRRGFMKAAGAAGAGIAALKTGLLGFGKEAAPVVEKVAETVSETAQGVPPYFLKLVEKIKNLGDDVTETYATQDRQKITKYKDYELTEDVATGRQEITRMKVSDDASSADYYGQPLTEETYMSYTPGEEIFQETAKGKTKIVKTGPEYEEGTALLRSDREYAGEVVDEMSGISDDIFKEVGEEVPEAIRKTKADGGRIGFSKGKLATNAVKFLEKIFGKESMAEMPKRDPEMYQGMLEVVDMFRNRDKKGLKKYLQKFLPHMDDAQVEDLIVGDAEDLAGLQKFGLGNLQGQLIRLGSGRDYAGKIEAIKKLEDAQKLDTLDVTEEMIRKPNAFGGIQTMLGE